MHSNFLDFFRCLAFVFKMPSGLLVNSRFAVGNFIHETSVAAKVGCLVLCVFYLVSFVIDPLKILGITPGNLIPPNFWIWTIFTHQFIEVNCISLLFSCVVLVHSSQVLEPLWTLLGYLTFFGIVTIFSGLCSGICYLVCYMLTFNISYLFDVSLYGLCGYAAGYFVALKQSRGDRMLVGSIGLYVMHLPLLYICAVLGLRIAGLLAGSYVIHVIWGTMISWIYLRFYQSHSRGRGDNAEKFAFKTFFPSVIQTPVGILADLIFNFLLKIKVCRKTTYKYDVGAPSKITITLSGVHALDAERRR